MSDFGTESIVVAATSARSLAALAVQSGFAPIALDVFGDRDTRALASHWCAVGAPSGLAFDPGRLLAALSAVARRADVSGWIAGSGFEAQLELLSAAARCLPLLGNSPATVERVRTPASFYPLLSELHIAHPQTRFDAPSLVDGWLFKNARACGGWHVDHAGDAHRIGAIRATEGRYYQRFAAGTPMSALFLADGRQARLVGFARQIVRPVDRYPFVFRGAVGPVTLPGASQASLARTIDRLVEALGLVGLNGIDFLEVPDGAPLIVELNPRPTATISLFPHAFSGGLLRAHIEVCRTGAMPDAAHVSSPVRGFETVFAPAAGRIAHGVAEWMSATGWCRDLPAAGTQYAATDPVCSVHGQGDSPDAALRVLDARCAEVLEQLETGGN